MFAKRITEPPVRLRKGRCQVPGWLSSQLYSLYHSLQAEDWMLGITENELHQIKIYTSNLCGFL